MIFSRKMAHLVAEGKKTQTRRPVKYDTVDGGQKVLLPCSYKVGRHYALQRGRGKPAVEGKRILIVHVPDGPEQLGQITLEDAKAEGFRTRDDFFATWVELYGEADPGQLVWPITFDLLVEVRFMASRLAGGELIGDVRDYTHGQAGAVKEEGQAHEVPPEEWMRERAKEGRENHEASRREQLAELDKLPLPQRLAILLNLQAKGANVDREVAAIENRLKAGERKAGLRMAA